MRAFNSEDGRSWVARLYEGEEDVSSHFGWEAVLFEPQAAGEQSIVFRPAGWLRIATGRELLEALTESEWVRARWTPGA